MKKKKKKALAVPQLLKESTRIISPGVVLFPVRSQKRVRRQQEFSGPSPVLTRENNRRLLKINRKVSRLHASPEGGEQSRARACVCFLHGRRGVTRAVTRSRYLLTRTTLPTPTTAGGLLQRPAETKRSCRALNTTSSR